MDNARTELLTQLADSKSVGELLLASAKFKMLDQQQK